MSWKGYLLVGTGAFFIFLLLYLPADLVHRVLQNRMSSQQVELHGLEGTWLSGMAASGRIQKLPVSNLSWQLRPSLRSLMQAKISFIVGEQGKVRGRFSAGMGGKFALTDLEADLPLQLLQQLFNRYGFDLDGQAALRLSKIKLQGGTPREAEGALTLAQLRILKPMNLLLGDFKGEVTTSNEGVRLVFSDTGGQLSANGILLLKPDGSWSFSGDFAATGQDQKEVAAALRLLGPAGRDGRVRVAHSGKLKNEK